MPTATSANSKARAREAGPGQAVVVVDRVAEAAPAVARGVAVIFRVAAAGAGAAEPAKIMGFAQ